MPVGHAGRGETQLIMALDAGLVLKDRPLPTPLPAWLEDLPQADPADGARWIDRCVEAWVRHLTAPENDQPGGSVE